MDHRLLISATFISLLSLTLPPEAHSASFKLINRCRRTIWPGFLSGANSPPLSSTGFELRTGKSRTLTIPKSWSGRLWARTLCAHHSNQTFSCVTGDCGSGKVECAGGGAAPPTTLAEFTLNGAGGLDFYDVSLVDGYNLPMLILPKGGSGGGCSATGCLVDLNGACPADLRVARGTHGPSVACKSACEAFGDPRYCCSEAYATPDTCGPSVYSLFFKHACPRAYSFAYDDKTSTYTCASADYVIIFCPPPYTSQKLVGARKDGAPLPLVNKTTMYIATDHSSGALSSGLVQRHFTACAASILSALLLFWPIILPL
ncbi:thaumatin-like protein 1b isoform X2 [Pistacia vera]|uniref:thaumatin-like protein 1b isoform X1 n=1 Tax=Pistacia vera TaxID=55513 RepID=UPI001263B7C9|nr:thaumatin-like protein 1b isoform X1 [Pistacia vera]XP_031264544.1 thaumatin-like protein 1b isoform X2 [Pistacia vera]XP_031264545.1 thaumatin-like protein 1b isoform X2 [Pistacia vera]KAJ0077009.1 hypothetical protein Patl1_36068 [Pistacia atlantica]